MVMSKHKSMLALWIACCAILMAALAPSVSHLLARAGGMPAMAEICSVAGIASLQVAQDGATRKPAAPGSAMNMADCPYCSLHADLPALPPAAAPVVAFHLLATAAPRLFYHAPTPLFSWAPPQSRAPPAIS